MYILAITDQAWISITAILVSLIGFVTLIMQRWWSVNDRRLQVNQVHQDLGQKIDQNTDISVKAFDSANSFNDKLTKLAVIVERMDREGTSASSRAIDDIDNRLKSIESLLQDLKCQKNSQ